MNAPLPVDAESRQLVVARAIGRLKRLTMLPDVTMRIVTLIEQDAYSAEDLEKLVSTDPALCLRILKIVNSAFYGAKVPVSSLKHATVILGAPAIKNIALATSLGRILQQGTRSGLSARDLWRHSLAVAAGARLAVAATADARPDDAFLVGLLHDVGFIVQMQLDHAGQLATVPHSGTGNAGLLEAEIELFGASHTDFGRGLTEQWGLPRFVSRVIDSHHFPTSCEEDTIALSCAVHVADVIAQQDNLGCGIDTQLYSIEQDALEELRLTAADLGRIAESLPSIADELQQILT